MVARGKNFDPQDNIVVLRIFLDGKFLGLGRERMIGESVLICMLF